ISYSDAANVTSWAQLYVSYCEQLGLIDSHMLDNNKFFPNDAITRAEVASILANYADRFGK
ncbi:MAG: S-layer homology domain-containing protein, partial [Clostridia bacterium]|nr:S-layer homology domain-containing protein [Clostridia bacterium]